VTKVEQYKSIKILSSLGYKYNITFDFGEKKGFFTLEEQHSPDTPEVFYVITTSLTGSRNYENPDDILKDLRPLLRDIKLDLVLDREHKII
jgi:hypothetical protein